MWRDGGTAFVYDVVKDALVSGPRDSAAGLALWYYGSPAAGCGRAVQGIE